MELQQRPYSFVFACCLYSMSTRAVLKQALDNIPQTVPLQKLCSSFLELPAVYCPSIASNCSSSQPRSYELAGTSFRTTGGESPSLSPSAVHLPVSHLRLCCPTASSHHPAQLHLLLCPIPVPFLQDIRSLGADVQGGCRAAQRETSSPLCLLQPWFLESNCS